MLTRKWVCEQAEHVKSPQEMEYDVAMKTRTNLCRNIGALNGVSIRKNASCGSVYNTETEKCTTLIRSSCSYFTFGSLIFIFSFHSERALKCMRTSKLSDCMYAQIIKYCLVYFCVAFSRALRNYESTC